MPRASDATLIENLPNLGPASAAMLRAVGIRTRADLEQAGAVLAYAAVRDVHPGVSANLLYALHGALTGTRWDRLPQSTRVRLRREVEAVRRIDPGPGR